jgi:hypothetical protein
MSIDLVIPLGKGSKLNNELRYSLRSIEKYLKNYRNIYIIGECPDFIQGVIHIPLKDKSNHQKNIMLKILEACNDKLITQEFLFWNDDFFLLKEVDAPTYPYYFNTWLVQAIENRMQTNGGDMYCRQMTNTFKLFEDKTPFHFDIHCPIIYDKDHFKELVSKEDWSIRDGYIIKSMYANSIPCNPQRMEDCKINMPTWDDAIELALMNRHIFSVGDAGLDANMWRYLYKLYPTKCKYEI